ncbi:phosphoribosyltransferase-like protein [Psychrobacter sp. DM8]|uniref:phosphoribosyltransferase-like protein n=1 Tax=Psychrobacter sp. DM8 TaxID=3440636 RepID=UPI003F507E1F
MKNYTRLSQTRLSEEWISQFETTYDKNIAKELLDSLKYVSIREFETALESSLIKLVESTGERIAVYPVTESDTPASVFYGKTKSDGRLESNSKPSREGRKKKYGSEDRVGGFLEKVSSSLAWNNMSRIECIPTINTINNQGIENIVLVDDFCGSGVRISGYYKNIFPASLKRKISLKKIKLWLLIYAANSDGIKAVQKNIKYFSKNRDRIIIIFPETEKNMFSLEVSSLCKKMGMGYKGSTANIVFEHGCPNNIPNILWKKKYSWKPLFPERSIPIELRPSFGNHSTADLGSTLWASGQNQLALSLYNAIDENCLDGDSSLKLTVLGLLIKNVSIENLAKRILVEKSKIEEIVNSLLDADFLYQSENKVLVSSLGMNIIREFKSRKESLSNDGIDNTEVIYYPTQCDGHPQFLGRLPSDSKEGCTDE